jgi:hypothetical protein
MVATWDTFLGNLLPGVIIGGWILWLLTG